VMNLVINAAEAIEPPGGRVTVATCAQSLDAEEIARQFSHEELKPGRYVVLEVRDTGHGMDEETKAKIFDPFFTTKFTGRGLGLAAVLGIVRGHKGAIRVESERCSGSTFRVFLPASARPVAVAEAAPEPAQAEPARATVLVVDDEEMVRRLAQRALSMRGHGVLLASDGREAIEVLRANRDTVSVILLDLTMPAMSGEEALPRLREIRPDVRILASSGYSESEAVRRFGGAIDGFIQKPYAAQKLLALLQAGQPEAAGGQGAG